MPLDGASPIRFRPRSLSDTLDETNARAGACRSLSNLIPDPSTYACLQCRPAATVKTSYASYSTPGIISVAFDSGDRIYGLVASARNAGKDEPFCYDVVAGAFISISGITNANTPTTPASSGAWTPPTMDAVGPRIIVTHPGFAGGGGGMFFGYFDTSGLSTSTTGNITSGSPTVTGNPNIGAVGPGYLITGTGIPANTTITSVASVTPQSTGDTHSNTTVDNVAAVAGFAIGQPITGVGIPAGTTITNIVGTTFTISQAATATAAGITISATGATITMSANAAASTNSLAITISGGTEAAPLWAAGNVITNGLTAVPKNVRQFNNRAEFSVGNKLAFTDALSLTATNANQVLTIGDTTDIIALCPLSFLSTINAVVAGLLVFKANTIVLITGDPTTNDLAQQPIGSKGVGTGSQRSVIATPEGVLFADDDGIRVVQITGSVTEPIEDTRVPFINPVQRSRISAGFNKGVYRICVQNGSVAGNPYQEFWYDFKYKMWTGPHTFRQDMVVPYKGSFIAFSNAFPAKLYQSDIVQTSSSSFTENTVALTWKYITSPLEDPGQLNANSAVESTVNIAYAGAATILATASDENGGVLSIATLTFPGSISLWNAFTWGAALWFGIQYGLRPFQIAWTNPLVFTKLLLQFTGLSSAGLKISNLEVKYQPLNYIPM